VLFTLFGTFLVGSLVARELSMVIKRSLDLGGGLGEALIWEPNHRRPDAVLICSHGIQSYSRWFEPLGERLASRGVAVWAFDRPGSGIAREQQHPLDVDSWNVSVLPTTRLTTAPDCWDYFRFAHAAGVSSAIRLTGKSLNPGRTEPR